MKILEKTLCFLLCLLAISVLNLPMFSDLKQVIENIVTSQPIQEAVERKDNIISVFLGHDFMMKELKPDIKLPFEKYTLVNGIFYFVDTQDYILKAGAEGIVKNIGYKGDEKYIEILHDGNIKTVYHNVDIIGVNTNRKVKKGDIISTIIPGSEFKLYVTYNNEILTEFVVENGVIVWKS